MTTWHDETYLLNAALKQGMVENTVVTALADGALNCWSVISSLVLIANSSSVGTGSTSLRSFRMSGELWKQPSKTLGASQMDFMAWQTRRGVESANPNDECRRLKQERETCRFI